jgi:hypothetical protein
MSAPAPASLKTIREKHLTSEVKIALSKRTGKVASSSVVAVAEWPSLGRSPVDVVIPEGEDPRHPRHVLELKWCQWRHDKVYEAIWDLFKIALLTRLGSVKRRLSAVTSSMAVTSRQRNSAIASFLGAARRWLRGTISFGAAPTGFPIGYPRSSRLGHCPLGALPTES